MKITKGFYFLLAFFAIAIGLYPLKYLLMGFHFDSTDAINNKWVISIFWDISFYTHITFGGIALLIGWTQFSKEMRKNYLPIHKIIGKTYTIAALLSALGGIYIALFAMGGIIASAGFISLGLIWLYTTLKAYLVIRKKNFIEHERMMVYSYAACCAAVTLRLWLPLLELLFNDFDVAYEVVAWWCWIPNLVVANYLILQKHSTTSL